MKERLLKTALHVAELAAAIGAAYLIVHLFNAPLPPEVLAALFAAVLKFQRSGDRSLDYVNGS